MKQTEDIGPGDVHAWVAGLHASDAADKGLATLSDDEKDRARRFRFEKDRVRFVHAHVALRHILGRYAGCEPGHIVFTTGEHGKPALHPDMNNPSLRFNLSHSQDVTVVAVTLNREVGVDVQHTRERFSVQDIVDSCFSTGEAEALRRVPEAERQAAFYRCWARKEAFLKALGTGLHTPLNAFEVSVGPEPRIVRTAWDTNEATRWTLADLPVPSGYAATVAAEGNNWTLVERHVK